MATDAQKLQVKQMLVNHLHLRIKPEEIGDADPLFGEEGLGLDSVDGIELAAGIEQEFGVAFAGEEEAQKVFIDVNTLTDFLVERGGLK